MAIQEIESKDAIGTVGIERKINAGAKGMIFDIVQSQQYQKPVESTVRELAANAVDAQSEKEKAIEILTGKSKPEDYFIHRDGELYADSNWNPSYYDLKHLNAERNDIELIYKQGEGIGRTDKFIVRDYGVGIGQGRLAGILSLGYSTKRNRRDALGAFGLGAKVGLSTGAEYYDMITVYNGVKYHIRIFKKKFNSVIGKFNSSGELNTPHNFYEDDEVIGTIYGEKTNELNYTQIEVPCLKHHKQSFDTAVKTQLLFFDNVVYFHEDVEGNKVEIPFRATVKYNSDNIIIAEGVPYSKPYVVIVNGNQAVGVCYGHIEFKELELEDMYGAVGIKCNIRQCYEDANGVEIEVCKGVDVIASREAVQWNTTTREYLKEKFTEAKEEATQLVEKELLTDDFLEWVIACKSIASLTGDSVLNKLSRIVDFSQLSPKFNGTDIKYSSNPTILFGGFELRLYSKIKTKDKDGKFQTNKEMLEYMQPVELDSFYVTNEWQADRERDIYLCDQHDGKYTLLKPIPLEDYKSEIARFDEKKQNKLLQRRSLVTKLIKESKYTKLLREVKIPEDYRTKLSKIESGELDDKGVIIEKKMTPQEIRELQQRLVCNTFTKNLSDGVNGYRYGQRCDEATKSFKLDKCEPKIQDVLDYEGQLYWGNVVDDAKLQYAAHIVYATNRNNFYGQSFQLVQISVPNKKHFKKHSHINSFFGKVELIRDEKNIPKGLNFMVDNLVVLWNTARRLEEMWGNLNFFNNFKQFNPEMTELYEELRNYKEKHSRKVHDDWAGRYGASDIHSDFCKFLNNIQEFQHFVEENPESHEDIAEKAKELATVTQSDDMKNLKSALVVDSEILRKFDTLITYANPLRTMLNEMDILTDPKKSDIPNELSIEIEQYVQLKSK